MSVEQIRELGEMLQHTIEQVIVGKEDVVEKVLVALLASGHLLLEDLPGTGKTTLAKALAKSLECDFKRIQFTPDLLPSDLIGTTLYHQREEKFEFMQGPLFTHILLADEINRATPRTQSSLLECMEERQVTVDGKTYQLERPFLVIATQNPIETQGTFPLPEAQLDRFLMRLSMGYPEPAQEVKILDNFEQHSPLESVGQVVDHQTLCTLQECVKTVRASELIKSYIVRLVDATRKHPQIRVGVSTRGALGLLKASQARAALYGRDYVIPEDVKALVKDVFGHRIICKGYNLRAEHKVEDLLDTLLATVPIE